MLCKYTFAICLTQIASYYKCWLRTQKVNVVLHFVIADLSWMQAAVKSRNDAKNHTSALESLIESRFASLERLIAMQTMFYHMAAHVASFW